MALTWPNHNRDFAKINLLCWVFFDQFACSSTLPLPSFDMEVNLTLDLISKVPNPSMVRVVRVCFAWDIVFQMRFRACWYITKNASKTNLLLLEILMTFGPGQELRSDTNNIGLMLVYAVLDRILDKLIEWLDLLVNHTILLEKCMDDIPLIINIDLPTTFSIQGPMRDCISIMICRHGTAGTSTYIPLWTIGGITRQKTHVRIHIIATLTHLKIDGF